jgi:DNA processing protein
VSALPLEGYAAALAALPGMGPVRLAALLARWPADEAWDRAARGRAEVENAEPGLVRRWRTEAASVDLERVWQTHLDAGVAVHVLGGPGYPDALAGDHEAPAVLFSRGRMTALEGPRVTIVGSRRCTQYGRDLAHELGRDLAAVGVRVVSGLALGVDGAAHVGALAAAAAPPVAVVGSGLDVVYPRSHARLWAQVAEAGLVLSEAPLGGRPESWRFPARNRILAALADVVVVVESRAQGGSRHTVNAADERGVKVMAVPGPVRSPASAYANDLLATGSAPARDVTDVLVALHLEGKAPALRPRAEPAPPGDPVQAAVLEAMGWQSASLEQLVGRTGHTPGEVSVALARLEVGGAVVSGDGWWERAACDGSRSR